MEAANLSDREFTEFRQLLYRRTGIALAEHKKPLVAGRLLKRLHHHGLASYKAYLDLVTHERGRGELQVAMDLLTTNETYFYREPKHFEFLRNTILAERVPGRAFRLWCAASSSGEEPYTLAFELAEVLGLQTPWEIVASDISSRVLETARRGRYADDRAEKIPQRLLSKYCLKGTGPAAGQFLITKALRERVRFELINLNEKIPEIGLFDAIFIRNVMIYFNLETKQQVVARLVSRLQPHGYFIVSHSESLHGVSEAFDAVKPSIYRKR